jgi:hypothetical protein
VDSDPSLGEINLVASVSATWEDMEALRQRFPEALAQGGGGGGTSPLKILSLLCNLLLDSMFIL